MISAENKILVYGTGIALGLGLWLIMLRLPIFRKVDLADRLAPYLPQVSRKSNLLRDNTLVNSPFYFIERLLAPFMKDLAGWVERISGGSLSVRKRLNQLGKHTTVEQFRAEQVVWGALGLIIGVIFAVMFAINKGFSIVSLLGFIAIGCLTGVFARDYFLTKQVKRRETTMMAEFPTIAELLALSVSAGEGAVGALERVSKTCQGELSLELRRTLADARAGSSLVQALEGLANRTSIASLARFVDGVAVAVERGTPLAEVLRAQAQDVRELGKRQLMETGGKKEIAMMVPVVFLILPVTILFAIYPGIAALNFDF